MIVLDTNQLDRYPLDSSMMGTVKVLARAKNQRLAISEVTFNEHCAHHENRLRRAYLQSRKSSSELAALRKMSGERKGRWYPDSVDAVERRIKRLSASYQAKIRAAFEVIPLDGGSAIEALRREAWRIAPASTNFDARGTGARDAAIWLSLIMESTRLSEEIFLVSSDKQAFTAPDLSADVSKSRGKVIVVSDLRELLAALAETVPVDIGIAAIQGFDEFTEELRSQLTKADILWGVVRAATDPAGGLPGGSSSSYDYGDILDLKLTRTDEVKGHSIAGGQTWATGRVCCDVSMPVRIKRRAGQPETVSEEKWTVGFQIVFTFIFKSAPKFEDVEILGIGNPSQITSRLDELRQVGEPILGFGGEYTSRRS